MKYIFIILVFLNATAQAQDKWQLQKEYIENQNNNSRHLYCEALSKIATPANSISCIVFNDNIEFKNEEKINELISDFELSKFSSLHLFNTIVDEKLNTKAYIYLQYYQGFKIVDAQLNLHTKNHVATSAMGTIVRGELPNSPINITTQQALQVAQNYFGDETHSQVGTTDTIWCRPKYGIPSTDNTQYELCYSIELKNMTNGTKYFISCTTGKLVSAIKTVMECVASANNNTLVYGAKTINTKKIGSNYYLINDCNPTILSVLSHIDSNTNANVISATNAANTFGTGYATAAYNVAQSYNYYKTIHNREGQRGDGHAMGVLIDKPSLPCYGCVGGNAYAGDSMLFGNNGTAFLGDDWYTLDIVAHEMTHTVTYYNGSGGLDYHFESGALNESFSDIMGNIVEMYEEGYSDTSNIWQCTEDRVDQLGNSLHIRDMRNPNLHNDPAYYLQVPQWYPITAGCDTVYDQCGVHTNSGVQNHFFYIATTGNAGLSGVSFVGLGIIKARTIAYKTLTGGYLTPSCTYSQVRDAWVHAAVDLYGNCSAEAIIVGKAWEAVGIGSYYYYGNTICGTFGTTANTNTSNNAYFISPNNCGATILGTGNLVKYDGGNLIDILPGFNTNTGAFFIATTNECWYSNF